MADPFNAIPLKPIMREFVVSLVDYIYKLPDDELKMTPNIPGGFKIEYDHPQLFLLGTYWDALSGPERTIINTAFACKLRTENHVWQDGQITFVPVGKSPLAGYICTAILQV